MTTRLGDTAAVLGAGVGGLAAAAALAPFFDRVVVLERDVLPDGVAHRDGTPQSRHVHALLAGGEGALNELLPGFTGDLRAAGAVPLRVGLDVQYERPGFDPFPRRDLGWVSHAMSRPLMESVLRQRVRGLPNVELRSRCRVNALVARDGRVRTVSFEAAGAPPQILDAALIVDATGRAVPTLDLLATLGEPLPEETSIGVDIHYASAVFAMPQSCSDDWLGVFHFPNAPHETRGALLLPMEHRQWIVTLGTRFDDKPPNERAGFMRFLRELRRPTLHEALCDAELSGEIRQWAFPASVRRHFERLGRFPGSLIPLADAICRFNPIYGQGMSVASQEALLLSQLLAKAQEADLADGTLAQRFFAGAQGVIETPWAMAAVPDLVYPATRGERPVNFAATLQFAQALTRLAAKDPDVHKLTIQVQHLLKPNTVYREPALVQRVLQEMSS
ncbi:hypothetical protein WKW77_23080 [Variovorax ureilyticus]|uniref:2-polyprenyl-6-methoxyphenol hydroxylase n=1 Tax=Variovorax ureilyticus TaxID=1836198 RepID=A0ABU8VK70_9BURK